MADPVQVQDSILDTTKKMLGFDWDYTAFDLDIMTHINSVFFTLQQLGVGQPNFSIEDNTKTWAEFEAGDNIAAVKSYMYLKVRIIFDPPANSFTQEAMNKQATEYEWRLNAYTEGVRWRESQIPTTS
ncbi:virion structural protein [Arthrobacter phage Qui]|uniref:Uncharacterized protein n=1 Tax=Arthrobacter phage Qui TaxID=2603260 RepID=A0A5B8WK76_9CAUD|nr:virion structural protein [Arthrobacter phage Qui]QED11505.1 hypothetical protein SEA_QUI_14 [Arthrobacter phage Qui]QOC56336.1 hypothetical protein SEA_PAELLA_14 [Arthrobacter phage Paella]